jgi:hypothetical protein
MLTRRKFTLGVAALLTGAKSLLAHPQATKGLYAYTVLNVHTSKATGWRGMTPGGSICTYLH